MHVSISKLDDEHQRLLKVARAELARKSQESSTTKLEKEAANSLMLPHIGAFGLRVGDAQSYRVLPQKMETEAANNPLLLRWRIELYGLGPNVAPLGIDVCGDVVLGRAATGAVGTGAGADIDFDLTPYNAADSGVSRRHALLRPSANKLFLIDLDSTNGTRVNSVVVSGARGLAHNDTISLGNLTFQVKIIDQR
jgi:hypothetical protein